MIDSFTMEQASIRPDKSWRGSGMEPPCVALPRGTGALRIHPCACCRKFILVGVRAIWSWPQFWVAPKAGAGTRARVKPKIFRPWVHSLRCYR